MDFEFTKEQNMLQKSIREFIRKEYPPERAREDDENENFPDDLYGKMAELGWMALPFPEKYGGFDGSAMDECIISEELGRISCAFGLTYFLSVCFGGKSLEKLGTEEQKQFYLRKLCEGEFKFALALTEPDGGTDILGTLRTEAVEDGDNYVINGNKTFITGAHVADYLIVVTRTSLDESKRANGLTLFIVDAKSPGVDIQMIKKMGIKSTGSCEIFFNNVVVPKENILGKKDQGWYGLTETLNNERVTLAAITTGMAQGCLDQSVRYAKDRMAFGKPIGKFQTIQHYMAEMSTDLDAARLLTYRAAWLQEKSKSSITESAKAKMFASETALKCATKGMRIFGGVGYTMEFDMQRFYRDAILFIFAPISNEMCKNVIGEVELKLPRSF